MLELAEKLNSVASNDESKKQNSSKHDSPVNVLGQSRRLSDHSAILAAATGAIVTSLRVLGHVAFR